MTPEWEIRQLRKDIRLPQIRSEIWQGLVFVNFDPDAAPLTESLHRLEGVIEHYRMADLFPAGIYRHAGLVIKGGEDVPGRQAFPLIDGLTEDARADMIFLAVPPSLFIVVYPHGIKTFRITPRSAGVIDMRVTFFYPASTIEMPEFGELMEQQMKFVELIDQPDIDTNQWVFKGLKSRFAPRGPLGPQERTLPQLYQWLGELCSAAIDE